MPLTKSQANNIPSWAEKMLKKHDIMIKELKKEVRYSKDLVEDHERWLRKHNLVLKDKKLL